MENTVRFVRPCLVLTTFAHSTISKSICLTLHLGSVIIILGILKIKCCRCKAGGISYSASAKNKKLAKQCAAAGVVDILGKTH